MITSYIDNNDVKNNVVIRDSYLSSDEGYSFQYLRRPVIFTKYDVFADLDLNNVEFSNEPQKEFLNNIIDVLRTKISQLLLEFDFSQSLLKPKVVNDSDGAVVLNWVSSNCRAYINIETEIENSFFGVVLQDQEQNFQSVSGKIDNQNYGQVVDKIMRCLLKYI